jgi:hypothetical protein
MNFQMRILNLLKKYDGRISKSNLVWIAGLSERVWSKSKKSYSSHAEDLIVDSIVARHQLITGKRITFSYLDIGAWRPIRNSNTYRLYRNGVRGTVVEPNSKLKNLWKSLRPRDQYIESACHLKKIVNLYEFDALAPSNSSNIKFVKFIMRMQNLSRPSFVQVKALKLHELIEKHIELFPGDFMLDIDIEGDDENAILSHTFTANARPIIILIEDHFQNGIRNSSITKYLSKNDYALVGRSVLTSIFIDKKSQLVESQIAI